MKNRNLNKILFYGFVMLGMVILILSGFMDSSLASASNNPKATQEINQSQPEATTIDTNPTLLGPWTVGPTMCFDLTRLDGEYYPGTGLVYFLGGRTGANTVGNIYSFDPVTSQCLDTGVVMPDPVSNYTVNLVNNGTSDLLCTFGGRNAAGGSSLAVQCYDPNANTASLVTTLPVEWTGYGPGTQVVVDNMVYIFGGFNSTAVPPTPFMTARTDKYDPVANTFTQVGDLNLARSYIMATAVDGIIYAFGGDTYESSALVAQVIAEKMDPAVGTWDDASVADLPVAGDEGRAFGFNSDSPYGIANQIVIATLAQWSGASAEVILYDVASNTYDITFDDLINARRNHAGVFIPTNSDDPNDGLPGMWVFGGYLTGDNPPYAPAEFYPMAAPTTCNVLLVDDDWDFDQTIPNDGGRPYYTSALDALGDPYVVWDTVSQGDPTAADMAAYDAVIWFTGYAWEQGVFTPANEADAATYLDSGGNFLLSSQEYHYEAGVITPFMANYLGVQDITDDAIELDPVGNTGNPIGDGLGPYTMVRPDDWAAYWPTGDSEGPYDDYANPLTGAESPFRFNASTENNSTNLDSGIFKSAFLAWPFEWIDTVDERVEILGAALGWMCAPPATGEFYLTPPGQDGSAVAGGTIPYTLTIINSLGYDESFDISYASVWPTSGPASVAVPDGDSVDFVVTVTTPADANCYAADTALVTAAAAGDPTNFKTANLNSSIAPSGSGGVEGMISDANTSLGIENAYLYMELGTHWFETYTDADGFYSIPNVPACIYTATANAYGYFDIYGLAFDVSVGDPISEYIALNASVPVLTGAPVNVVIPPDSAYTYTLNLANQGSGDLYFHVSEVPAGSYPLPLYTDPSMPSGVDPQVLANIAAAPDGTTKFIVYMRQQADLSAAYDMDWAARGQYVLDTLRTVASQTQANLVNELNQHAISYESRYIVNALVVNGDLSLVNTLASHPDVGYIGPNTAVPAPAPVSIDTTAGSPDAIEWNISQVFADQVWITYGVTGDGIVLSNMDTGVQWDHPALINQYRGWDGLVADHNYNWWDPYNQNPLEPTDADSHGTHTMGTMLGDDGGANQIGVAPGAQWLACDGFNNDTGFGYDAELLECAEFLLAPWDLTGANPDPAMRPDIINNSWGGGQGVWWYNQAIYAWRAAGIMGIFSAGNAGSNCSTAGSPGDSANMLAVGATDINDNIAGFSSRGPAAVTGILKPNVSAPGVNIRSSVPGNAYQGGWQGTSMAAPHVAGTVALIWSAVPELRGDVQLTSWIIEQSADGLTTTQGCGGDLPTDIPNNVYGWGRINAYEAVSMAMATDWDIPWLDVDPVGGTVATGGSADINLAFDTTGLTLGDCYTGTLKLEYNDPFIVEQFVPVEVCIGVPDIEVAPLLLELTLVTGETGTLPFTISNVGPAVLTWDVVDDAAWLSELPASGTIASGGSTEVVATFDAAGLASGEYTATIDINSDDPDEPVVTVDVVLTVVEPDIAVAPLLLEMTLMVGESDTLTFTISNVGTSALTWDLTDDAAWLSELPASGTITPDGFNEVVVTFDAAGLAPDVYTATINVNSDDPDEAVVMVDVMLTVIPAPVPDIEVSPLSLALTLAPDETGTLPFRIGNLGPAALEWSLADDATWLSALPASGTIPTDGSTLVTVTFDATGLAAGEYQATITITSNDPDESPLTLDVTLTVEVTSYQIYLPIIFR